MGKGLAFERGVVDLRILKLILILNLWGCVTTSQRSTYTVSVSKGETLAGLAHKYDTTPASIMSLNGLRKPVVLKVGQKLVISPGPLGLAAGQELLQPSAGQNQPGYRRSGLVRKSSVADPSEFKEGDYPKGIPVHGGGSEEGGPLDLGTGNDGQDLNQNLDKASAPGTKSSKGPETGRQRIPVRSKKGLFFGSSSQLDLPSQGRTPLEKAIDSEFGIVREDDLLGGLEALALEPMRWPLRAPISSHFGHRHGRLHRGVDLMAAHGSPLWAAAEGTVVYAGWKKRYGKVVIIQHQYYQTLYAHLSALSVKAGEWVDLKKAIGKVGATGNARGTHLHFEVIARFDEPIDPVLVMNRSQSLRVAALKRNRSRNTRIQ